MSIRAAVAVAASVAIAATALPAAAAQATVNVTGPPGSWAVLEIPRGKSVTLSDIDFGATYDGRATGTFIRPLERPAARPGDPRTFFAFFAAPPTSAFKRYVAQGESGPDERPWPEQALPAGRYVVLLLGAQTAQVRFPGIADRDSRVDAVHRMRHRFVAGAVPGTSDVGGWSGRTEDAYDLSRHTVVATSAEFSTDADVSAWHHCVGPPTMSTCRGPGLVDREPHAGGYGTSRIPDPRVDPVRGHVLTTYDGLRRPELAWRSFLSFDASAGQPG